MSWLPLFRKNKPDSAPGGDEFYSRPEQEPSSARSRAKRKASTSKREPVDPALPEKKRARRRLVGAVALVLALVIGLPMILDSEPKPLTNDISIQIPSRNKPPAPEAPVLSDPAPAKPSSLDAAEEIIEPAVTTKPSLAAAAPVTSAAREDAKPAAPEPLIDRTPVHARAPEAAPAKPEPKPEQAKAAPHALAAVKVDDAARAKAILEGKFDVPAASSKAADGKSGKFVVQVAALASADKVGELRGKLTQAGIASYTQKVATASGDRIRIRVGPFANHDEAEQMRARLVKLGLNGTLVPA